MGIIVFMSFLFYGLIGEGFSKGWIPQLKIFNG